LLTPTSAVIAVKCAFGLNVLRFATMDVKKKHEIEAALAIEAQAISAGQLKEENPLDLSDDFRAFCEACRRGDLKVCQEKISEGVNINARDKFDYTPLILVRLSTFTYARGTDRCV
jgi:ankyrin repeat protein